MCCQLCLGLSYRKNTCTAQEYLKQKVTINFRIDTMDFEYPLISVCPLLPFSLLKIQNLLQADKLDAIVGSYVTNLMQSSVHYQFHFYNPLIISASSEAFPEELLVTSEDALLFCVISGSWDCKKAILTQNFFSYPRCFTLVWNSTVLQKAGKLGTVSMVLFTENSSNEIVSDRVAAMTQHLMQRFSFGFNLFIHSRNQLPMEAFKDAVRLSHGKSYEVILSRKILKKTNQLFQKRRCTEDTT